MRAALLRARDAAKFVKSANANYRRRTSSISSCSLEVYSPFPTTTTPPPPVSQPTLSEQQSASSPLSQTPIQIDQPTATSSSISASTPKPPLPTTTRHSSGSDLSIQQLNSTENDNNNINNNSTSKNAVSSSPSLVAQANTTVTLTPSPSSATDTSASRINTPNATAQTTLLGLDDVSNQDHVIVKDAEEVTGVPDATQTSISVGDGDKTTKEVEERSASEARSTQMERERVLLNLVDTPTLDLSSGRAFEESISPLLGFVEEKFVESLKDVGVTFLIFFLSYGVSDWLIIGREGAKWRSSCSSVRPSMATIYFHWFIGIYH